MMKDTARRGAGHLLQQNKVLIVLIDGAREDRLF